MKDYSWEINSRLVRLSKRDKHNRINWMTDTRQADKANLGSAIVQTVASLIT